MNFSSLDGVRQTKKWDLVCHWKDTPIHRARYTKSGGWRHLQERIEGTEDNLDLFRILAKRTIIAITWGLLCHVSAFISRIEYSEG